MSNFTALARGLVVFDPTAGLLGDVRDVDFFATGLRALVFPARVLRLDFRVVGFLAVPRGVFLAVAFLVAAFLEVFFAVFFVVVFFAGGFLEVFLADDFSAVALFRAAVVFLDVFLAAALLAVFFADVFLGDVFFAVVFLRAADVFFLPDVFFAGAMAAGR